MNKLLKLTILVTLFTPMLALSAETSVVGFWKTIDDETLKPSSIVEIFEKDAKIFGKIVKVFPREGNKDFCEKCPDDFKDKPILGLQFMWDLAPVKNKPTKYDGGKILDPKNGSIYRSKLELIEAGQKLEVRGYIGVSLFGRSQTWLRAEPSDK